GLHLLEEARALDPHEHHAARHDRGELRNPSGIRAVVVLAIAARAVGEVQVAVDVDVPHTGLWGALAQGPRVPQAGRVAGIVVATQAHREAATANYLGDAAGDALRCPHHVGGIDIEVADVDKSALGRPEQAATSGHLD